MDPEDLGDSDLEDLGDSDLDLEDLGDSDLGRVEAPASDPGAGSLSLELAGAALNSSRSALAGSPRRAPRVREAPRVGAHSYSYSVKHDKCASKFDSRRPLGVRLARASS